MTIYLKESTLTMSLLKYQANPFTSRPAFQARFFIQGSS